MGTPSPPRPRRESDEDGGKERDRPRFFDAKAKALCWQKAEVVPGRHPERWRKDPAGNVVCKRFWNCYGCICYEYDHIIPFSKGDPDASSAVFEEISFFERELGEGRVCLLRQCGDTTAENCQILQTRVNRLKSDKQLVDKADLEDKELDIIEMATYGDVIRPGNQCRCRTVAEMLGKVKLKNPLAACELPYKENQ
ncbi:hypothetical protein B296_00027427 [Ensete ventricosum]|uniref:HNH domain-containing protein n=1 Tax=Ensete ventricosum TaxID=4639 RepID=A0A426YW36_ENSVE|nr:hypothetical protein B296_00027427 [Ensete ventricosum]